MKAAMRGVRYFTKSGSIFTVFFLLVSGPALGRAMNGGPSGRSRNGSPSTIVANPGSSGLTFHGRMAPGIVSAHGFSGRPSAPPRTIFDSRSTVAARSLSHARPGLRDRDRLRHRRRSPTVLIYNFITPSYFPYAPYCDDYDGCYPAPFPYNPPPPMYPPPPVYPGEDPYANGSPAPPAGYAEDSAAQSGQFDRQGDEVFKARDYQGAVRAWQHAVVDDPNNGTLLMKLASAFFAAGQYREAAGATQRALMMFPEAEWGGIVSRYAESYSSRRDYSEQLRNLEKAVTANPKEPALRFLLGFYYGYSGHAADAARELDKLVSLAPQDQLGRRLRDVMAEKVKQNNDSHFATAQDRIYVRRDSHGVLTFTNVPVRSDYRPAAMTAGTIP